MSKKLLRFHCLKNVQITNSFQDDTETENVVATSVTTMQHPPRNNKMVLAALNTFEFLLVGLFEDEFNRAAIWKPSIYKEENRIREGIHREARKQLDLTLECQRYTLSGLGAAWE